MTDRPIRYQPGEDKDREAREYVLHYVSNSLGGCDYQDVVTHRPAGISRSRVEAAVKHLLYRTHQLRSEHPEGTHAFGRGQTRLWQARHPDFPEELS